jgi:hypothetical protein
MNRWVRRSLLSLLALPVALVGFVVYCWMFLLDSSMQIIKESNWAQFSSRQIELLIQNGIPRPTAEHYYALTKR